MRERVALHGGELLAEPRPEGGLVVRASLPTIAATRQIARAATGPASRVLILTTFDLDEYVQDALGAGARASC